MKQVEEENHMNHKDRFKRTAVMSLWTMRPGSYLALDRLVFEQFNKLVHLVGLQRQEAERADRQRHIGLLPDALQHLLQGQRVDLPLLHLLPHILTNQSAAARHRYIQVCLQ